jgi:hypothetical protein
MRLYAEMGTPDQAVRQFHICEDVLRRELDMAPQPETVSLYHKILGYRVPPQSSATGRDPAAAHRDRAVGSQHLPTGTEATLVRPFVGRDRVLQHLCGQLARGAQSRAGMVLLTGEAGIGKTRLLEEFAAQAGRQGAAVLWSGRGAHAKQFACGLFAVALEGYAASRSAAERHELAGRYPALARFIPSLGMGGEPVSAPGDYHLDLIPAMVRLLTDLGHRQPVLLVLNDLHDADPCSLDLIRYLAHLAVQRPWLMVGAVREEEVDAGSELGRLIEATTRERLCLRIDLCCLSRRDCDQLVRALLPGVRADDELLARIYQRSRGNPLFVGELVRQLRERDNPALAAGDRDESWRAAEVPARVRALAAARLAAMDENLRRVLVLAAIAGAAEISLDALRAGTAALEPPISDAALLDALDQALQLRVMEERSNGFAFRYPLFRSAVYEGLSRHRRDSLLAALTWEDGWKRAGTLTRHPGEQTR